MEKDQNIYEELEQENDNPRKKKQNIFSARKIFIFLSVFILLAIFCSYFLKSGSLNSNSNSAENNFSSVQTQSQKNISVFRDDTELGNRLKSIDKIMRPRSIAVLGVSVKGSSIGSDLLDILRRFGYKGNLYPVNPKGGEINGFKVYKTVTEIPEEVDLAIIVVNSKYVLQSIDQCNEKGIKGIMIISAGFREIGVKGELLQQELKQKIKGYGMRCIGPNILGAVNTNINMDACFDQNYPEPGDIGCVSQSGALGTAFYAFLKTYTIGISQFIGIGNQVDVSVEDILEYWEDDDTVKQIMVYSEGVDNPEKFRKIASKVSKKKPITAIKAGLHPEGAKAATKHTGSITGSSKGSAALLKQSGIIQEITFRDLLNTLKAFQFYPLPKGNRIGIITLGGGSEFSVLIFSQNMDLFLHNCLIKLKMN